MKTNAARLLDTLGIRYELREYEAGDEHLAAEEVAARVGLPSEQVFKTLVARGDRTGVMLAVVPGDAALACKKEYATFVDETMELFDVVSVSAGVRGTQILLAPADYLRATKARVGAIAKPKES
jgi:Cys-tRNA(Pro)/Cys-tRNA(Cys) deacylase